MTLSARNNLLRGGIIFAALSLLLAAAGGYFAFSAFPEAAGAAGLRSQGVLQHFAAKLAEPSAYVPFWTIIGLVAYSLISIILIYYFFENTQSPEILFFAFFIISLSFEFTRILLPLKRVIPFPSMYLITASRILLFGRYFGLLSLFAAGVYAAGLNIRKQQYIFLVVIAASLYIALNLPVDSLVWDSSFMLKSGYNTMFSIAGAGILIITMLTFFISAHTRGSGSYITIGIGVFLALAGRDILLCSDNWITPLPGLFLLGLGTWFTCTRLHREYLWL